MNRKTISRSALFLTAILLIGMIPFTAAAANNEYVLTSINHIAALSAVDVKNTTAAVLTVPHDYPARTVNLAIGLDIQYDTEVYASATATFPSAAPSTAIVDGDPITMTVTYQKKGSRAYYSTDYKVRVVREKLPPAFEGTISKKITFPGTVRFTSKDFTDLYRQNGGSKLVAISITGSTPSFGKLKIDNAEYVLGNLIRLEDLEAGKLTYQATAAGTVSFIVKAYQSGDGLNPVGAVTLTIESVAPHDTKMDIKAATTQNTPLQFSSIDFADIFKKETGQTLSYVKFSLPDKLNGKLYYNYGASTNYEGIVTSGTAYSASLLKQFAYVPDPAFLGSVVIRFTGFTDENIGFNGSLTIVVSNRNASDINYKTEKNSPLSFSASDFNKKSRETTGKELSHVFFSLPAASNGTLYYKYESVSKYGSLVRSDIAYNVGKEPLLDNVDFVPAKDFAGAISIAYTGYNVEGTAFSGTIKITVEDKSFKSKYKDLIKKYPWAADALQYFYENGMITDESLKKFRPNSGISKGDFILLVSMAFDLEPAAVDLPATGKKDWKDFFGSKEWKKWFEQFDWDDWEDLFEESDKKPGKKHDDKKDKKDNGKGNGNGKGNDPKGKSSSVFAFSVNGKAVNNGKLNNWLRFMWALSSKSMLKCSPKSALSRQDAMVIVYEAMKEAGITLLGGKANDLKVFKDHNKISAYARDPIASLVRAGIVDASGKKLDPNKSISQIEAYVLLYKALQYQNK